MDSQSFDCVMNSNICLSLSLIWYSIMRVTTFERAGGFLRRDSWHTWLIRRQTFQSSAFCPWYCLCPLVSCSTSGLRPSCLVRAWLSWPWPAGLNLGACPGRPFWSWPHPRLWGCRRNGRALWGRRPSRCRGRTRGWNWGHKRYVTHLVTHFDEFSKWYTKN